MFRIVKFPSMVVGADEMSPAWMTHDDPRRTRVGRVLRTRGLDELPELLNVWRGDLSLVGPRPLNVEEHATMCREVADFPKRLTVRPSVTGLAQLYNRSDDPYSKLDCDLKYIREMSLALGLGLIVESIRYVVFGRIDDRSRME